MRLQKKRVSAVVIISLVMAAIRTIIIQYDMEKNDIDNDTYYLPDNAEVTAFTVAVVLFMAVFLYAAFSAGRKKSVKLARSQGAMPAASLILAFSLIGAAVMHGVFLVRDGFETVTVIDILTLAASLLSAAKFIISGIKYNARPQNSFHALAALAPICLSVLRLLGDFIRTSAAPMASSGAYHIVGLVCVLLYFLCEGKSYVSETSAAAYYGFGYLSLFFLSVYSVPNLIMHCFGTFCFDQYAAYSVADLGLVVYISARLASAELESRVDKATEKPLSEQA